MTTITVWHKRTDGQWQPTGRSDGKEGFGHSFNLMYWRWNARPFEWDVMRYW